MGKILKKMLVGLGGIGLTGLMLLACQGIGSGSGGSVLEMTGGVGSAATSKDSQTNSEDTETTETIIDDVTKFRPAALPPAVDEPSYAIKASLTLEGTTAIVNAQVTDLGSGEPVAGVDVSVVHVRFTPVTTGSAVQSLSLQESTKPDSGKLKAEELEVLCVQTDAKGEAFASVPNFDPLHDKIWMTVGCGLVGYSSDVILMADTSPANTSTPSVGAPPETALPTEPVSPPEPASPPEPVPSAEPVSSPEPVSPTESATPTEMTPTSTGPAAPTNERTTRVTSVDRVPATETTPPTTVAVVRPVGRTTFSTEAVANTPRLNTRVRVNSLNRYLSE